VLLAACLALIPIAAAHADADTVEASICVVQVFTVASGSAQPSSDTFSYYLIAEETSSPMPSGTQANGKYDFQISGDRSVLVGPICFDRVGVYRYRIAQDISGAKLDYTYDDEIYTVTILVQNSAGGIVASVYAPRNSAGYKESAVRFSNGYDTTSGGGSGDPKTGDTTNLALWVAGMLVSLAGFLTVILTYRRRRRFLENGGGGAA